MPRIAFGWCLKSLEQPGRKVITASSIKSQLHWSQGLSHLLLGLCLTDHLFTEFLSEEFCISFCEDLWISEQILDVNPWDDPL